MEKAKQLRLKYKIAMADGNLFSNETLKLNRANLLVFYKRSCPTCTMFLPYLTDYLNRFEQPPGGIFLISQDSLDTTLSFIKENAIKIPVVIDTPDYRLSRLLNLDTVPAFYLLSASGELRQSFQGFFRDEVIEMMANFENLNKISHQPFFQNLRGIPVLVPG